MTIVTCVKVRDGLVLGTDSMAHIQRGGEFGRAFTHARKLFQLKDLPIGVMSYGLGNVGHRSIESLIREFEQGLRKDQKKVGTIANALFKFMKTQYDSHAEALPEGEELPGLGIALAGYSPGAVFAEERQFELPGDGKPNVPLVEEEFGATWWGVAAPFFRLSMGYGPLVRIRLEEAGLETEIASALLDDLAIDVFFDAMPVQDAVDYATFVLNTTVDYTRFAMQVAPCGGPLQVATILPDGSFKWLARPEVHMKGI
jgi:hypothetical protein